MFLYVCACVYVVSCPQSVHGITAIRAPELHYALISITDCLLLCAPHPPPVSPHPHISPPSSYWHFIPPPFTKFSASSFISPCFPAPYLSYIFSVFSTYSPVPRPCTSSYLLSTPIPSPFLVCLFSLLSSFLSFSPPPLIPFHHSPDPSTPLPLGHLPVSIFCFCFHPPLIYLPLFLHSASTSAPSPLIPAHIFLLPASPSSVSTV